MKLLTNIINTISLISREKKMPLGRWHTHIGSSSEIKGNLANIDCCGGPPCGDPETTKKMIDKIIKKKIIEFPKNESNIINKIDY